MTWVSMRARSARSYWRPCNVTFLVTAIVGIEIEITKMVGKWKLSQNKEARDRINVVEELRKRDEQAIAKAMMDTVDREP